MVQILLKVWVLVPPTPFCDHHVLCLDHGDVMSALVLFVSL